MWSYKFFWLFFLKNCLKSISHLNLNLTFCWITQRGHGTGVCTKSCPTHLCCLQNKGESHLFLRFKDAVFGFQKPQLQHSANVLSASRYVHFKYCRSINSYYICKTPAMEQLKSVLMLSEVAGKRAPGYASGLN